VFEEKDEIEEGILICSNCNRWYPIIETIPHMLPDDLREEKDDLSYEKIQGQNPRSNSGKGKALPSLIFLLS